MHVAQLWRYPVKSMGGEPLAGADVGPYGIVGDRQFGVVRSANGHVLSAKREARLLDARARLAPSLEVTLPTGKVLDRLGPKSDHALTEWLGYPVRLAAVDGAGRPTFESQGDFFDDESDTMTWQGFDGSWADSQPIHVLGTATLDRLAAERPDLSWEVQRFRPNILVATDDDVQGVVVAGTVRLRVVKPCTRCVMIARPQPRPPGGRPIDYQIDILRHVNVEHEGNVGVLATVVGNGHVTVGDVVTITPDGE